MLKSDFFLLVAAIIAVAVIGYIGTPNRSLFEHHAFRADLKSTNFTLLWRNWKKEHNKTYSAIEDERRSRIFTENYQNILLINTKRRNFTVNINKFTDMKKEEFCTLVLGLKQTYLGILPSISNLMSSKIELINVGDDTIDWRTKTTVTPVKNQGKCGSGWAFSAIGSLEGYAAQWQDELQVFSEQQLIDCSETYGNQGCRGGTMKDALMYTSEHGVMRDADYQYTGLSGNCTYDRDKVQFKSARQIPANSDTDLKKAVSIRPVSISVEADHAVFQFYSSGILDSIECGVHVNHGALAVGYGVDNGLGYWIVKNSWGSDWGEQGYVKIARASGNGICGINTDNILIE